LRLKNQSGKTVADLPREGWKNTVELHCKDGVVDNLNASWSAIQLALLVFKDRMLAEILTKK